LDNNSQDNISSDSGDLSLSDFESDSEEEYIPPGENHSKFLKQNYKFSTKFLIQWYWNGLRWAEADNISVGRKFQKKEFTIISWNIWFGLRNRETRMLELGKVVRQYDPDLIAFQEVTPELLKMLLSQKWLREYFITDNEGRTLDSYGNVIFSKIKFYELSITLLESRMGR